MSEPARIPIFVSSVHRGLEDLRGELVSHLLELGALPLVSSETGFPDHPDLHPYVQCLRVLEESLIVIGIVDRRYGSKQDDWAPFDRYRGLSPTHAEFRHALREKKRLLIYVRSEVQGYYEIYLKNRDMFEALDLPSGLDIGTLQMLEEMKTSQPAPWIEGFRDVRDIKDSIRRRLLHDLHEALRQREILAQLGAELLLDRLLTLDPELRQRLVVALNDMPLKQQAELREYLDQLGGGPPRRRDAHLSPAVLGRLFALAA